MRRKRRNHSPSFKAKVVLTALQGDRTLAELSQQFGAHPNQITQWKRELVEGAARAIAHKSRGQCQHLEQIVLVPAGLVAFDLNTAFAGQAITHRCCIARRITADNYLRNPIEPEIVMVNTAYSQRRHLSSVQWQALFDRFDAGDDNVTAFCRRHGVSPSSFYRWRRKLAEPPTVSTAPAKTESSEPAFIEAGVLADEPAGPAVPATATWDVELVLGDGIILRLRRG